MTIRQWHHRLIADPNRAMAYPSQLRAQRFSEISPRRFFVHVARVPLLFAAVIYGLIIRLRNRRFDRRPGVVKRVSVPVISVGNITTGGTGKTPLVADAVERLQHLGRSPAVVTRGYRSDRAGRSDEATLLSRTAGVPCIVQPDRVAGAEQVIRQHHADVIVLDDAFQHRGIGRDLDIVAIDVTCPFGLGHLLPRGFLREPPESLRRAHVVVLTRTDQVLPGRLYNIWREVGRFAPQARIVACVHRPLPLRPLVSSTDPGAPPRSGRAFLISAIGNPASFETSVRALGFQVCGHASFDDHHTYTARDVLVACTTAAESAADIVLVTEKDAVKLEQLSVRWYTPAWVLGVRIDFLHGGGKIMDNALRNAVKPREELHAG